MSSEIRILERLDKIQKDLTELSLAKKEILNFEEACAYLSVSESHLYKMTSKREVPCYQPNGKKLYFNRVELNEWILKNRKHTNDEVEKAAADYILANPLRKGGRI